MAGIVGIIRLGDKPLTGVGAQAFSNMKTALGVRQSQAGEEYQCERVWISHQPQLAVQGNDNFIYNGRLNVLVVLDGVVYIEEETRLKLVRELSFPDNTSDHLLLPYMYRLLGHDLGLHISGSYNLLCYSSETDDLLLINDRLGFLPLFMHISGDFLVFGSRIECVLASGLVGAVDFDMASLAEHLYFNYIVSDSTYIRGVQTLPNATVVTISSEGVKQRSYWNLNDDCRGKPLSAKDSFELIDTQLEETLKRLLERTAGTINCSLTGGWDSRLVLSYLLPNYRERLNCYSFGADRSDDVAIPSIISKAENLHYKPFILDDEYLESVFLDAALKTIINSGGTRNYKRTHYLYAMREMGLLSSNLLTGIYGDELLKVGKPQGGAVISANSISLLESGFDPDLFIARFKQSPVASLEGMMSNSLLVAIQQRVHALQTRMDSYPTIAMKYLAFRFEINLRKYFGNEALSYNDHCLCHSPFVDHTFIKAWLSTRYAGHLYDFVSPGLREKKQSTDLYVRLVMRRHPQLAGYPSSRGFSMLDAVTVRGKARILARKYLKQAKSKSDAFNTSKTDEIFECFLQKNMSHRLGLFDFTPLPKLSPIRADLMSLAYWVDHITTKYA